ncbi:type II toxin-antitoxin system PemK/MazF family toxin [Salegentibacter salarius]|uniref:type II toxin-antitoxin system PemK/MazF family toxin n=1 Tax=Salegentibacter salarius TaxID=435906 RepID=UPI001F278829|nr:type II toxin-antitoxin system PemK/MazF family toxin [Salegentibacter salarius]
MLVSFPFTNLKGSKRRPAVILYIGKMDVVAAFITSRIAKISSFELLINPSETNRLKKPSLIKTTKICTLDKNLIVGKLGELTEREKEQLNTKLKEAFAL